MPLFCFDEYPDLAHHFQGNNLLKLRRHKAHLAGGLWSFPIELLEGHCLLRHSLRFVRESTPVAIRQTIVKIGISRLWYFSLVISADDQKRKSIHYLNWLKGKIISPTDDDRCPKRRGSKLPSRLGSKQQPAKDNDRIIRSRTICHRLAKHSHSFIFSHRLQHFRSRDELVRFIAAGSAPTEGRQIPGRSALRLSGY